MATGNFILDKGYRVAAGQTISKYRVVKFSAAETVTPTTAITDVIAGVAQFAVSAAELLKGKGTNVRVQGISEVEASAAIVVGAPCGLVADGRVRTATAGDRIVGKCVGHPAGTAGDRISMMIDPQGAIA